MNMNFERVMDVKGEATVAAFINEGNVRVKDAAPGIEIGTEVPVTVSQLNIASRFISKSLRERGMLYLDITDPSGKSVASATYEEGTSTSEVVYDIKDYYERGTVPVGSDGRRFSLPIDKKGNSSYNLYTTTQEFVQKVPSGDREIFSRSLANKTADMQQGEIRTVWINGSGGRRYWLLADGYMHGRMVSVEKIDPEEWQGGHKEYGTIHENAEIDALWNEDGWSAQARRSSNVGDSKKRRGTSKIDSLHEGLSRSDTTGDFERGSGHPRYTRDQVEDIIQRLKDDQKNLDSTTAPKGVKNSLPLDTTTDGDFDPRAVLDKGTPRRAGKANITVAQLSKTLANNTRLKVFSKKDALKIVNNFSASDLLTEKFRGELATQLWALLNDAPDSELDLLKKNGVSWGNRQGGRTEAAMQIKGKSLGKTKLFLLFLILPWLSAAVVIGNRGYRRSPTLLTR